MIKDNKNSGKEKFIKLLKQVFDVSTEDGYNFNFKEKGLTQHKVAKKLGRDKSTISRMLQPSYNGTFHEVNKGLQNLLDIRRKEEKKILFRKLMIPFLTFFLGVLTTLFVLRLPSEEKINKPSDYSEINTLEQFKFFYKTLGVKSATRMADAAAGEMYSIQQIYKEGRTITDDEKIQYVKNMSISIISILTRDRDELRTKNYRVKGEVNIVDFVDYLYPLNNVFLCAPEEIAISDTITDCIEKSPFDKGVYYVAKEIFREKANEISVRKNVLALVRNAQLQQAKKTGALFECYIREGKTCFSNK